MPTFTGNAASFRGQQTGCFHTFIPSLGAGPCTFLHALVAVELLGHNPAPNPGLVQRKEWRRKERSERGEGEHVSCGRRAAAPVDLSILTLQASAVLQH